jgi:methyl-accepting chemotaxis protein
LLATIETAEAIIKHSSAGANEAKLSAARTTTQGFRFLLGAGITLAAITAVTLIALALSVLRPITFVTRRLQDIAEGEGDLTQRLDANGKDEIATLAGWFNKFLQKLERTIAEVTEGAEQIEAGSSQVSSASQSLASGASEQAASLDRFQRAFKSWLIAPAATRSGPSRQLRSLIAAEAPPKRVKPA